MKQDFRFHTIRTVLAVVLALFSAAAAGAQGRFTVTGKVSDASGKPMVGVTIIEQGTTNGTTTGLDGTYSLVVKSDRSVLQFSSLGYTSQSVTVGSKNEIDVSLSEDAINMSEVVVTGYGRTVTKDKLTAAISKVSSDVLEKGVRSNALTALAGAVTGVRIASTTGQPGAAPSIVIRGGAALDGSGSPLYVIDGVQREDMNDINANDIESIEILKDAAATALYGARANAGVVLVTTKRGRVGRAEISFKANVGLTTCARPTSSSRPTTTSTTCVWPPTVRETSRRSRPQAPSVRATSSRQTATSRPRVSTARCSSPTRTPICSSRATRA